MLLYSHTLKSEFRNVLQLKAAPGRRGSPTGKADDIPHLAHMKYSLHKSANKASLRVLYKVVVIRHSFVSVPHLTT